jgi:hypothetical protein
MAFQGSTHNDHYYVKVSADNQVTWETLFDLSSLPPYPGGYNQWQVPYVVDMSIYQGETVDIAWHAKDENGQGLWYYWGIDDCTVGAKKLPLFTGPPLYDVYRQDPSGGDFIKANNQPLDDTVYVDPMLPAGLYYYYVQVVNPDCSEALPSDTISVDVITSIDDHTDKHVRVFPNPACDWLEIKSDMPVSRVLLFSMMGVKVADINLAHVLETRISLDIYPAGQYLLQVYTPDRPRAFLISVVR